MPLPRPKPNLIQRLQRARRLKRLQKLRKDPKRIEVIKKIGVISRRLRIRRGAVRNLEKIAKSSYFEKSPLRPHAPAMKDRLLEEANEIQMQKEQKQRLLKQQRKNA